MEYDSRKVKVEPVSPKKVAVEQNIEYNRNSVIGVVVQQTNVKPETAKLSTSSHGDCPAAKSVASNNNHLHLEDMSAECDIYKDSSEQDTSCRRNDMYTVNNKCVHDGHEYHNRTDVIVQHHPDTDGHIELSEPLDLSMKHHSNIECIHDKSFNNSPDFRFQQNTAPDEQSVMDLPLDLSLKHMVMHDKVALGRHSDSMETQSDVHCNTVTMPSELLPGKCRHASRNEECNSNLNIHTEWNSHADIPLDLSMKSVAISVKLNKDNCTHPVATELDNPVCKNGVSQPRKRKFISAVCEHNLTIEHPITEHLDKNIESVPSLKVPTEHYTEQQTCQIELQYNSTHGAADLVKKNGSSKTSFNENKKRKSHERIRSKDKISASSSNKSTNNTALETGHVSKNCNKRAKQKVHQCDTCKKVFSTRRYLTKHRRTHTGEKRYICDECGKAYTWIGGLKAHKLEHTGEKYACKVCGYSSTRKDSALRHEIRHTGEKPYVCSVCGYAFADSSNLNVHKRIHTGEKAYVCSECGRAFAVLSSLKKHERIHTGEKPYVCKVCGYASTQLSHLKTHERIHTGEKPYVCSECGHAFTVLSSLKRHERTHTGEKPYVCSECGSAFTVLCSLRKHERLHTG